MGFSVSLVSAGVGLSGVGLSFLVPEMRVLVFPGMFQDYAEVDFVEKKYRDEYTAYFEKRGLVLISWGDVGFSHLHSSTSFDTYAERLK